MERLDEQTLNMLAAEAFIRRSAETGMPFMLKGSHVTRQYLPDPNTRYANDLDWVYMGAFGDPADADTQLTKWATAVTEISLNDGVVFRNFNKNPFWRSIDYAMADDFPTVNTDLLCWINGIEYEWFSIDVSFNIDIEPGPVPLLYKPISGDSFTVPYTCPLALQIAWKLHQVIVRPRFKDIFDLIYLLEHPEFTPKTKHEALQALVNECRADNIDVNRLNWYISDDISAHSRVKKAQLTDSIHMDDARHTTPIVNFIPDNVSQLLQRFRTTLKTAGFTSDLFNRLPVPTRTARKNYSR